MTPQSILVTGAQGFVGHHLMARLEADFPEAALHAAAFDVTDGKAVSSALRSLRPQACIHLGAISAISEAGDAPQRAWAVNLTGTLLLAQAVVTYVPNCLMVYASSADAYGTSFAAGVAVDEKAPLAPVNTYGATKAAADLALGAMARDGLRVLRIRPFNHTGPGQSDRFVVAAFARQLALILAGRQEPVLRVGSLDAQRDFLDVRDVVAAYSLCLARAEGFESGSILNIASGTPRRIGDILDALLAISGVRARVEIEATRMRQGEILVAYGDASRARRLLGWVPMVTWDKTLRDVLQDWRHR